MYKYKGIFKEIMSFPKLTKNNPKYDVRDFMFYNYLKKEKDCKVRVSNFLN